MKTINVKQYANSLPAYKADQQSKQAKKQAKTMRDQRKAKHSQWECMQ